MSVIPPETDYIKQCGELPKPAEIEELRAKWNSTQERTLENEWEEYWLSRGDIDMLEYLYLFWALVRDALKEI